MRQVKRVFSLGVKINAAESWCFCCQEQVNYVSTLIPSHTTAYSFSNTYLGISLHVKLNPFMWRTVKRLVCCSLRNVKGSLG